MRHCLQTESALPSSWNAVISVSDYMGTLKQCGAMNLFGGYRQLASMRNICEAFFHSMLRRVDFEGYEAGEDFLFEDRDIC